MQDTRCVSYCNMVKGTKYHFFVVYLFNLLLFGETQALNATTNGGDASRVGKIKRKGTPH